MSSIYNFIPNLLPFVECCTSSYAENFMISIRAQAINATNSNLGSLTYQVGLKPRLRFPSSIPLVPTPPKPSRRLRGKHSRCRATGMLQWVSLGGAPKFPFMARADRGGPRAYRGVPWRCGADEGYPSSVAAGPFPLLGRPLHAECNSAAQSRHRFTPWYAVHYVPNSMVLRGAVQTSYLIEIISYRRRRGPDTAVSYHR